MTLPEPVGAAKSTARRSGKPWEQQKGENSLWYARFLRYVALGPTRSISLASRGRRNAYPVPAHWQMQAKQLNWRERAAAFDEAARKDPKLVTWFDSELDQVSLGHNNGLYQLSSQERDLMKGLRYQPPDEDDNGEPFTDLTN